MPSSEEIRDGSEFRGEQAIDRFLLIRNPLPSYFVPQRPFGRPATAEIDVADGRDTFLVVHVPETGVVGRPLVGGR